MRDDGPQTHHNKAGTPTMGGLLFITSMAISVLLWGNLSNLYVDAALAGTLLLSAVGFRDDYKKSILKIPGGMSARMKILLQILIALAFAVFIFIFPSIDETNAQAAFSLYIPFFKEPLFYMGILSIPFWMIVVVGVSNAVNLTDGLDGLAIGISSIVTGTLVVFAYLTGSKYADYLLIPFVPGANELAVFLAAITGAAVGFLWYNSHPAEVFMGDTGSLALGGAIGMVAICLRKEVLLILLGGIFVAEALSVILQVGYYKMTGKRIFKMAPLHHHFELKGWHENKVVIRFWLVGVILALVSLASLKIN